MYLALVGLALAWAAMLLFGGMEFDRGLLLVAYAGRDPTVTEVARWLTELGGFPVLIAATAAGAAWLLWRREWRSALLLAALPLSGRLLVELQKEWTERLRPDANEPLVAVETLAFPSGHAANATLVWLGLALLLPRSERMRAFAVWGAVWLALAVGISRVMLGVHWPSDVIAGWSFGLFWTLLILRLAGHGVAEGTAPSAAH
ncbi:MAG: phosphatase PAP2 family protein [Sphingosinicella sp.]|uniref:phosphatase PAP2 family protein n=1 Tax=Sphingosinicella sp. TaxID=1917971 RepID=UPI00403818B9